MVFLYLFFPFIVIFWKIPRSIYKLGSWSVAIAIINSFLSFFKSFKYNFISFSAFLIATVLILTLKNNIVLIVSSATILLVVFITFINRFILVFKPSLIYQLHSKIVTKILGFTNKIGVSNELKSLTVSEMSDTQLQGWASNLQIAVIANKACYLLSAKLKVYQKSRINIIFNIVSIILLFMFTVLCFGIITYGLSKAYPTSYLYNNMNPSFFNFLYYSFNAIHFTSIQEITATNSLSRGVFMIEQFFALLLGSIFFTLFLSIKNERETADINEVVNRIKENGDTVGKYIEDEYNLSVDSAIIELQRIKSSLINVIYFLSKNI